MPRLTAQDFDQELLILFDAYVHGDLDRRSFLSQAKKFAKAGVAATTLLAALSPDFAAGQQVPPGRSEAQDRAGELSLAFRQRHGSRLPGAPCECRRERLPAVLVIHENRGLNPHIEDIARRLALDGFMAFAPDALTPLGGYPGDEDKAREAFAKLDQAHALNDFLAAANWLRSRPDATGKLGAVGFCYGGGMVHQLAIRLPDLNAGVPFYGNTPAPAEAAKVKAPLLVQRAEVDERINAAWPAYEAALRPRACASRPISIPAHSTASTTTPRRATTRRPPTRLVAHGRIPQGATGSRLDRRVPATVIRQSVRRRAAFTMRPSRHPTGAGCALLRRAALERVRAPPPSRVRPSTGSHSRRIASP